MPTPILATKLFVPRPRPGMIQRPRLVERLRGNHHQKLTVISASAGFGKTTLITEWVQADERPVAWFALDDGDNDPARFMTYVVAALRTLDASVGADALQMLGSPQPLPPETVLTAVLNSMADIHEPYILVIDDYHTIETMPIHQALAFFLEHLPPQMHLVIATREDPPLPLAKLRVRGELTEIRAADLRFTTDEAASFLNEMMGLSLSAEDIAALDRRTEGWVAGLQLAAISMQGHHNTRTFIESFTGGHHFVLDYLVEEVLQQQPTYIQNFLLHTALLERLCGPLCNAVLGVDNGQETLEALERANLFLIPLDNERRWYRYHHLFADLLRQRLGQVGENIPELHIRASEWYEDNGLDVEAFYHATAAEDIARADRLIEGDGMPLHFRGAQSAILHWLDNLPADTLNAHPRLWTAYASVLLVTGQVTRVAPALQSALAVLESLNTTDPYIRDLIGRVAAIRSTLAASLRQVDGIIKESERALTYLHPDNSPFQTSTRWKLGFAYHLQGKRAAARAAYAEVIQIGQATGNVIFVLMAMIGMGGLQASDNQLKLAEQTFKGILAQVGDSPLPTFGEVHLGLSQIYYQWNDLDAAEQHAHRAVHLTRQIEQNDRLIACQAALARVKLAQGDSVQSIEILAEAEHYLLQHQFAHQLPDIVNIRVRALLKQGNIMAAADLAQAHDLPMGLARVHLTEDEPKQALAVLEPLRAELEAREWHAERLRVMVLQAIAYHTGGDKASAVQLIGEALALAAPGGMIRLFVDEGPPMAALLTDAHARGIMPDYIDSVLPHFNTGATDVQPLVEPLSDREIEVLQLVAEGLSNREIGDRLYLALDTVKGHNRRIYGKLQVQRRTEAVARARELGLI